GGENDVDLETDELGRDLGEALLAPLAPAIFDSNSVAFVPTKFAQSLHKRGDPFAARGTRALPQETDGRQLSRLLRARRERPRDSGAAEQRDELAAPHSITSSVRASTSRPSAFAILRLITSSNLVGLQDRQIGGFVALEDFIAVAARTTIPFPREPRCIKSLNYSAARLLRVASLSRFSSSGVNFGRSIFSMSLLSLPVKRNGTW